MDILTHSALAPRGALGEWARRATERRTGCLADSLTGHVLLDIVAEERLGHPYTSRCTRIVEFTRAAEGIPLATEEDLW